MPQENWNNEGVSDDNNAYMTEKNWKTNNDMVTSVRELESKLGGSIVIPEADASEDDRNSFYKKLGRPDTVGDYGYKMVDGGDKGQHEWYTGTAHKIGLSDAQTTALGEAWDNRNAELAKNNTVSMEKELQSIKVQYGAEYDSKIAAGKAVVKSLGLSDDVLGKIEQETGTAAFVDLFVRLGEKVGEGTFADKDAMGGANITLSKAQATEQFNSFNNDEEKLKLYRADDPKTVAYRRMLLHIMHD